MDTEYDLNGITAKIAQAQQQRARADVERENALRKKAEAVEILLKEFGLSSVEAAQERLQELKTLRDQELQSVNEKLKELET